MKTQNWDPPRTLGALRQSEFSEERIADRSVKDELRANLICKLQRGEELFPGVMGYEETVTPQIVNAILSRHNFILLGLRGQAKSRILRGLAGLLDGAIPVVPGCEINDDPLQPICSSCRARLAAEGDALPVAWLPRDARYVEKLATPDVTIADLIGDIDPIKAARGGHLLGDDDADGVGPAALHHGPVHPGAGLAAGEEVQAQGDLRGGRVLPGGAAEEPEGAAHPLCLPLVAELDPEDRPVAAAGQRDLGQAGDARRNVEAGLKGWKGGDQTFRVGGRERRRAHQAHFADRRAASIDEEGEPGKGEP